MSILKIRWEVGMRIRHDTLGWGSIERVEGFSIGSSWAKIRWDKKTQYTDGHRGHYYAISGEDKTFLEGVMSVTKLS
ncbi:TPA: hypothetical protein HA278_01135 [Candidatus Woesearchaeota archaeon]|nr:hypothetical protein [Candidatus Woesearchaeota archaeon]